MVLCMFWENYDLLCKMEGKSANTVAAECGVKSSGTVTGWRNGALPRAKVLRDLANHFGVSVTTLLGDGSDIKKEPVNSDEFLQNKAALQKFIDSLSEEEAGRLLPIAKMVFEK